MKKIKNYQEFCNEEINFGKVLTGAALAGSLLMSPTINATTYRINQQDRIELAELNTLETIFTKKITVPGTKDEVFKKVIEDLRNQGGRVSVFSKEKLSCSFTLTDVKPDNSNGFTNILMEINIVGNEVSFDFKKIEFFYSGTQPKSIQQSIGDDLKSKGVDVLTDLTRKVVPNSYVGNRLGSELQKTKKEIYKQPTNFTYQDAVSNNSNLHRSFLKSLNSKVDYLIKAIK